MAVVVPDEQVTEQAPTPNPIPLPENLTNWEDEQEAAQAAAEESGQEYTPAPLMLQTKADVERALSRWNFFEQEKNEEAALFASAIEQKKQELERLKERRDLAARRWERRQNWYINALEQAARATLAADPKAKTQHYPSGDLVLRAQPPEWTYTNEGAVAKYLFGINPALVRAEVAKTEFKKAAEVSPDGRVIIKETGEIVPDVVVTPRPPKFEIKTA